VHGGYAPSRKPLLKLGVQIYEIRPDVDQTGTQVIDSGYTLVTIASLWNSDASLKSFFRGSAVVIWAIGLNDKDLLFLMECPSWTRVLQY